MKKILILLMLISCTVFAEEIEISSDIQITDNGGTATYYAIYVMVDESIKEGTEQLSTHLSYYHALGIEIEGMTASFSYDEVLELVRSKQDEKTD